jgi:undecaprenyl-diphosphatase
MAWGLWRRGGSASAAGAVALSSGVSTVISKGFDSAMKSRRPPPGRHKPSEPSFPSGHSLETTAVALTSAYVLSRERVADPRVAAPLALVIPVVTGVGRLYLDRHWATDVAGGWLAGLSVAACCAALYEAAG